MASRKRALLEPTDDWQQLQFQLDWLEQTRYELIRPVVVFGAPPVERAKQTGVSARTIYRRVGALRRAGDAEPLRGRARRGQACAPVGHPPGDRPAQGRVPAVPAQ